MESVSNGENNSSPYLYDIGLDDIIEQDKVFKISANQKIRFHAASNKTTGYSWSYLIDPEK